MNDLISRQAAIDRAVSIPMFGRDVKMVAVSEIKNLPPAQPEWKSKKCVWCDSPYRIEYYWIDEEGCTASFQDEKRHIVATGIANFCPNCGADIRGEQDEWMI